MTARLRINLAALKANYDRLRLAAPDAQATRTGAVVKADAYGFGMLPVASTLWDAGCQTFFVATAAEGITLRKTLADAEIYVFEGALPDTCEQLAANALRPVLNHPQQLENWLSHAHAPVAVHVDTGMQRLGFAPESLLPPEMLRPFEVALLMTHFARADEPDHPVNQEQLKMLEPVAAALPGVPLSICNSAGTLANLARDHVRRPGIALYGGNPFAAGTNPMEVVANLEGQVMQVREVPRGVAVGYGGTYVAPRDMRVAIVGLGYADGLPRLLSNRGSVWAGGQRCAMVGRISMDYTAVDVSAVDVAPGDWVEFYGSNISIDEVGAQAESFAYELFCSAGARVERCYEAGS